jgi:hypothetical protein
MTASLADNPGWAQRPAGEATSLEAEFRHAKGRSEVFRQLNLGVLYFSVALNEVQRHE